MYSLHSAQVLNRIQNRPGYNPKWYYPIDNWDLKIKSVEAVRFKLTEVSNNIRNKYIVIKIKSILKPISRRSTYGH